MLRAMAGNDARRIRVRVMNRWRVVAGGVLMNLALGSLYAWSAFVLPLEKDFGWKRSDTSWVFTIAVLTFAAPSSSAENFKTSAAW